MHDHSFALPADRCSNEGVLDTVVSESFSEERICTQEIGEHLIVADDTSESVRVRVGARNSKEHALNFY